jgi:hypothetical protein
LATLKDLSVSWISLVKKPANGKALTLKNLGTDQAAIPFALTKFTVSKAENDSEPERMVAYGIVYSPDETDLQGDTADAVTIRRAAYEFMREGRLKSIDTEHNFNAAQAFVAESWLVRKGDAYFADQPEGSWAVGIQIGDPDLWNHIKSGEMTGISLAGYARETQEYEAHRYTEKSHETPGWFQQFLKSVGFSPKPENPDTNGDTDMTKDDIAAVAKAVVAIIKEDAAAAVTPPETPPAAAADNADTLAETVSNAIAKGLENIDTKIDDAVAKALAKGMKETGENAATTEESFL